MKLRRSTESTQKRKLQKKFDEVKRQFLEQEEEVETAKEEVAQTMMRLEALKLEQAKIDERTGANGCVGRKPKRKRS